MTSDVRTDKRSSSRAGRWLVVIGIALLIAAVVLATLSIVSGYGLRVRSLMRDLPSLARSLVHAPAIASTNRSDFRNVILLHHSVGRNLIDQGKVREEFTAAGFRFWDHDYNELGLTDPFGVQTGYNYRIPADNTDPDGLSAIFSQRAYGLPLNTFSALLQHEVIAFKSCYPTSDITSDAELQERKEWYFRMRDAMDQHPDKLFVIITQPPLNPAETKPEIAGRARALADWLRSDEFIKGHPNAVTFDLFGRFAENNPEAPDFSMLREVYRDGADSHPNRLGNETVGQIFADFVMQAADQYRSSYHSSSTR